MKMDDDGNCVVGHKKCGDPNDISKGICIPNASDCPITDLAVGSSNPNGGLYEVTRTGTAFNIYFTRTNVAMPVLDSTMADTAPCLQANLVEVPSNREVYPLMDIPETAFCENDSKWTPVTGATFPRKQIFDLNSVNYANLPLIQVSNSQSLMWYAGRLISLNPKCRLIVEKFNNQTEKIKASADSIRGTGAMISVSLILIAILLCLEAQCISDDSSKARLCYSIPRFLLMWASAIWSLIAYLGAKELKPIFDVISTGSCSQDPVFNAFYDPIRIYGYERLFIVMIALFVLGFANLLYMFLMYCPDALCSCKRSSHSAVHPPYLIG